MCRDCTALLGEAEQLVALAEAERLVILAETEAGLSVPHAIRPLYEHEIRAGVRFGDIWETLEHADRQIVARIARAVEQLEQLIVMHIPAGTPRERATALLADMLTAPPPDVQTVLDDLIAQLTAVFAGTRRAGQESVQVEAIFQGLALDLPDPGESTRDAAPALAAAAAGVAGLFFAQYVSRLIPAVNRPGVTVEEALRVVAEPGWKGVQDQARQETHVQHSAGRSDAAALVDGEPALYASELMDGRTCRECRKIDGRRFASEEEAAEFYPNGGPMRYCLGGNRCRGTLVFDWSDAVEGDDGELPEIEDTPVVPPVPVPA